MVKFIFPKSERVTFGKGSAFYFWASATYTILGAFCAIASVTGAGFDAWVFSVIFGVLGGVYSTGMARYAVYPQDKKEARHGKE